MVIIGIFQNTTVEGCGTVPIEKCLWAKLITKKNHGKFGNTKKYHKSCRFTKILAW